MRSPLLVLRHEPFEHLGRFAAILEENAVEYRYHDLGQPWVDEPYKALIIMGGPMSANDDLLGLREELAVIGDALREDLPMLGICLGAQLIAKALGAEVYRNPELEIGWEPILMTEAAAKDPVFGGLSSTETFFHWHGETFDLPGGAEWLACSKKCKNQAFRYGKRVYGIQFHPEITPEMIEDWCAQPVNCVDLGNLSRPIDAFLHDPEGAARKILQGWLRLWL